MARSLISEGEDHWEIRQSDNNIQNFCKRSLSNTSQMFYDFWLKFVDIFLAKLTGLIFIKILSATCTIFSRECEINRRIIGKRISKNSFDPSNIHFQIPSASVSKSFQNPIPSEFYYRQNLFLNRFKNRFRLLLKSLQDLIQDHIGSCSEDS